MNAIKRIVYKFRFLAVALLFAATAATAFVYRDSIVTARDCDSNAVMRCGAYSIGELKQKYQQNQNGNTKAIFQHFGINSEASFDGMVEGRVTGNNDVFVGNRKVAHNVLTVGRQNITRGTGSTPILGGAAYVRHPSVSFKNPAGSLQAYVKLDANGNFKYAVIKSCGNPVTGINIPPPPPPPPPPPKAEFKCVKLSADRLRIKEWESITFTAQAHVKKTQITGYTFHYTAGITRHSTTNRDTRPFVGPGARDAYVIVHTKAGSTTKVPQCTLRVIVDEKPKKPWFKCVALHADRKIGTDKLTVKFGARALMVRTKIKNYTFHLGDGSAPKTQTKRDLVHTYTKPGTYVAYVIVNTHAGSTTKIPVCTQVITVKKKVVPPPKPEFECIDLRANRTTGTDKLTVTFTATSRVKNTQVRNYVFYFGDNSQKLQPSRTVTHTYTKPGNYQAYVIVQTDAGNTTKIPACAVNITVKKKVVLQIPGLNIDKTVRMSDDDEWTEDVNAKPGDTVHYRVVVKNTGETILQNVMVRDVLPTGVSYVPGSFKITPAVEVGEFFREGINIGTLNPGEEKVITFDVKVDAETEACEARGLRNVAFAEVEPIREIEDDAYATVCKEEVPEQPQKPEVLPAVLPVTGTGNILGMFAATSTAGAIVHHMVNRRRRFETKIVRIPHPGYSRRGMR
ncbi:hypothetical protein BH23PAT1_BH23PAT1_2860 [soil metagenome]